MAQSPDFIPTEMQQQGLRQLCINVQWAKILPRPCERLITRLVENNYVEYCCYRCVNKLNLRLRSLLLLQFGLVFVKDKVIVERLVHSGLSIQLSPP